MERSFAYLWGMHKAAADMGMSKVGTLSTLPEGLIGAAVGATHAPKGQRANTALITGLSTSAGAGIGNALGHMYDVAGSLNTEKIKVPAKLFRVLLGISGAVVGGRTGYRYAKEHTWGALPRFRYEHKLGSAQTTEDFFEHYLGQGDDNPTEAPRKTAADYAVEKALEKMGTPRKPQSLPSVHPPAKRGTRFKALKDRLSRKKKARS